ncbi:MAG: PHB depolymerase family esterase [Acidiferrobacterales bacterium]
MERRRIDIEMAQPGRATGVGARGGVARGKVVRRTLMGDADQRYFLFLPRRVAAAEAPLLVGVHGVTRGAREIAQQFAALAEAYGVGLLCPLFHARRYADYQRLGRAGRGARADRALERILAEVQCLTGMSTEKLYLFGYSGGAQFVHRYAMAYPRRVAAMIVSAAGWYTLPDPGRPFPHGMGPTPELPDIRFDLEAFLRIPTAAMVGEWDIERDAALKQSYRVDRDQGPTRLERGRRWIRGLKTIAAARGLATPYTFRTLSRSHHSFVDCVRHGALHRRVFETLFGPASLDGGVHTVSVQATAAPAETRLL